MSLLHTAARTLCDDKKLHDQYDPYIKTIKNMAREWKIIFSIVRNYFIEKDAVQMDAQDMHDFYDLKYPNARDAESIHIIITELFDSKPKPDLIQSIIERLIEQHKATTMIEMLADTMAGDKFGKFPDVVREVESFHEIMETPPEEMERPQPVDKTISEMVEEELVFQGLEWPIEQFNDYLGGIRRRTLGLLYAFVDAGKTSLAMKVATCAAQQLHEQESDEVVCYCGNEEPKVRLALRGVQAFVECSRRELMHDPKKYEKQAMEMGFENIKFFDSMNTGDQLISVVKEYKPRLLVADIATDIEVQMEKHYGIEGVGYLKSLFKWYRRFSNRFNTSVLTVVQGTGDIENKKYPKLSDVMGSRSAVQGALDYAIGMGQKPEDASKQFLRYINISKNKLHDGMKGKFSVSFDAEINRWGS